VWNCNTHMKTFVVIWIIGIVSTAVVCHLKYRTFIHNIELEDLKNGKILDYDRLQKGPGILNIFGFIIPYTPPTSIIRETENEYTKKIIYQHNFFVKAFWVLFILPLPVAIIFYLLN